MILFSQGTFVRHAGGRSLLWRPRTGACVIADGTEPFLRHIGWSPRPEAEIVAGIAADFDMRPEEIADDFREFLAPLVAEKVVLCGDTPEALDAQEESFSYDVENPKTMDTHFIKPEDMPEGAIPQEVLERYFAERPTIFDLQIDVTQACTERCVHCYIPEYNPVFLPLADAKRVIDEFREQGGVGLSLSGGECMLHPDFDEIVRHARKKDLIVSVISNLTLCDDAKVRLLQEAEATVQVSLYSMNPETHDAITRRPGSWLATKTAIEKLRAAQIPCRISCPTMKGNYHGYLAVLDSPARSGWTRRPTSSSWASRTATRATSPTGSTSTRRAAFWRM